MGKIKQIRKTLQAKGLEAILITNPVNRRYMTGFTGSAGATIISENALIFITDFRYMEQATEQATDFTIIEHKGSIEKEINKQLKALKIKSLGFEKMNLTYGNYELYSNVFEDITLIPVSGIVEELRIVKSDEEIQIIKKAANIADAAFLHIQSYIKPGVKELDIANELEFFMRREGATSSSFDIIVASGVRSALPHGIASNKKVQAGELVTMDFGALYNDYCSDITRTVAVGEINTQLKVIYDTVLEAQIRGVEGLKPGLSGKEADALTRDYITEKGYGQYYGHSTGHGLGLEVHEEPRLSVQSKTELVPGMIVTVEPGIYIPEVGGCRIEDDLVITTAGSERLTHASKELVYL